MREVDAGNSDAYVGSVPADLVLLVGIFGNIGDADLERTVRSAPQLCSPGATVIWTHGRRDEDGTRRCGETAFGTLDRASRPTVGVARYDDQPVDLVPERQLFGFLRREVSHHAVVAHRTAA